MRSALFLAATSLLLGGAACSDSGSDGAGGGVDASSPGSDGSTGTGGQDATTTTQDAATGTDGAAASDGGASSDAGFVPLLDAGPSSSRFRAVSKDKTTAPNGFYEYLPGGYDGTKAAPLLVFWHGVGEDGDGLAESDGGGDLHKVPANGPPKLIKADQWANMRPFVVLSPQHGPDGCPGSDEIDAFMTWAIGHYNVDPKRIYLTGLSCGAIGSWAYVTRFKDKVVAATLLISGDPANAWTADGCSLISNLALWSVHGSADPTVNPTDDEQEMGHLLACPAPHADVKYNLVDGGGHDVWTKTYDLSYGFGDVYQWMLDHPKP
jgi:predicted peptidase